LPVGRGFRDRASERLRVQVVPGTKPADAPRRPAAEAR